MTLQNSLPAKLRRVWHCKGICFPIERSGSLVQSLEQVRLGPFVLFDNRTVATADLSLIGFVIAGLISGVGTKLGMTLAAAWLDSFQNDALLWVCFQSLRYFRTKYRRVRIFQLYS